MEIPAPPAADQWADAIDLTGDTTDEENVRPQAMDVTAGGAASSSAAGPSSSAADSTWRPAASEGKRVKTEPGSSSAQGSSSALAPAPAPDDGLDTSSFVEPPLFGCHQSRRAGHIMLHITARAYQPQPAAAGWRSWMAPAAPQTEVVVGTGGEHNSYARVLAIARAHQLTIVPAAGGSWYELQDCLSRLTNEENFKPNGLRNPGVALMDVSVQPPLPWKIQCGAPPVAARIDVWLAPEIFGARISKWNASRSLYYDNWLVLDKMAPVKPIVPTPRPPPVTGRLALSTARKRPASGPNSAAYEFTLAGLMRAMESAGYEEMADPPGLLLSLYAFQRQSLQWMYDRETQPGGLNALFWEERPSETGTDNTGQPRDDTFWYNPMAGELKAEAPPIVTGGDAALLTRAAPGPS
jgi:hypothetical protein